ncbi:hypothetical protein CR513_41786, partial [Mucuna pruriens]
MGMRGNIDICIKIPSKVRNILRRLSPATSCDPTAITNKAKNVNGPMDFLLFKNPKTTIKLGKAKRQTSINDADDKEARARTIQYKSNSFVTSYHECRVSLLKEVGVYTKELLKNHDVERKYYRCSIISNSWIDKKNRTLINFSVYCPTGSVCEEH